jgi:hypothetical protein
MSNFDFLTDEQVAFLCDTKLKSLQIEHLKKIGIPFRLSRTGKPRVACSAIEGYDKNPKLDPEKWAPNVLRMA